MSILFGWVPHLFYQFNFKNTGQFLWDILFSNSSDIFSGWNVNKILLVEMPENKLYHLLSAK